MPRHKDEQGQILDTMNKLKALYLAYIHIQDVKKDHLLCQLSLHVLATEHATHHQVAMICGCEAKM